MFRVAVWFFSWDFPITPESLELLDGYTLEAKNSGFRFSRENVSLDRLPKFTNGHTFVYDSFGGSMNSYRCGPWEVEDGERAIPELVEPKELVAAE